MKALIQRVKNSRVSIDGRAVGEIGPGLLVFLGVGQEDTDVEARYLAERTAALRIFQDSQDKMNLSVADIGGSVLVVSQFTLHADTRKGNRPSFIRAAPPELAERLYGVYVVRLRECLGQDRVATGVFRASMMVELVNDGPVTIELKSRNEYGAAPES